MNKIYITLPEFFNFYNLNMKFIQFCHCNKNCLKYDIEFQGMDGNLPFLYWNGGNYNRFDHSFISQPIISQFIHDNAHIKIILDCSNPLLENYDFLDNTQNILLQEFDNINSDIIISNLDLLEYIQKKYNFFNFIGSPFFELFSQDFKKINKIRQFPNSINLNIPQNKIELSLITPCPNCINFKSCQSLEWTNILTFDTQSIFIDCKKEKFHILTENEINNFISQGIKYFYIDCRTIGIITEQFLISLYQNLFIKNEPQFLLKYYHYMKEE